MGFYATEAPGVGGRLKERPESFVVREISLFPKPDPSGPFTVLRVVSRNWEQHELSQRIAQRLGLPPSALSWAGTKDRRAVAERLASYRGSPPEGDLGLPGVEVLDAYRSRDGLVLGHHFGNAFEIRLTELSGGPAAVEASLRDLRAAAVFPNFFGPQRFGEVRPVTHRVGREIVRGDVGRAVEIYLTDVPPGAAGRGDAARRAYAEHRDAERALREFPAEFRFERQLLDHLARGHDAARALRSLSKDLRTLFVHAYQALLFNRYLTARHAAGLPLAEPQEGDSLLRIGRDGTVSGRDPVPVGADNLAEASEAVRRGRAVVAGPLVGYESPGGAGAPAELIARILAEEGISPDRFRTPATPDLASAGTQRPLAQPVPPIAAVPEAAPSEPGPGAPGAWWLRFALPKGSYATVLLREIRKDGAEPAALATPSNRAY